MQKVDVAIIGAGPGGIAAAGILAPQKQVLMVENNLWGGTCPNFGCDPKKLLYSATQAQDYAGRMQHAGVVGQLTLDWAQMMAFKRSYTTGIPDGTVAELKQYGATTVYGTARFIDAHTLAVGDETFVADNIIIATGQAPTIPDIEGSEWLQTSTDFLNLDALPSSLAMIGAGFVGLELANIAASAGAEVHVINHSDRALRQYPQAAVALLLDAMLAKGIIFHDNVALTKAQKTTGGVLLEADGFSLTVEAAFASAGRHPVLPAGTDTVGIVIERHGIKVDDHLQTSVPGIYAIGDVSAKQGPKLTPIARFEGRYVAHLLLGNNAPISYLAIPQTLFGTLELAKVGVDLDSALAEPARYTVQEQDVTKWFTYLRVQEQDAHIWTIVDKKDNTLAGAVIVASDTEALNNLFATQIDQHMPLAKLTDTIYAYPTAASDIAYLV